MKLMFKPLLLVAMIAQLVAFLVFFGNQGEGRTIVGTYLTPNRDGYSLSDLELLDRVVDRIDRDYVDPQRCDPEKMLDKALERVQREVPDLMFAWTEDHLAIDAHVGRSRKTIPASPIATSADLVRILRSTMKFVEAKLESDVPLQEIEYAAINGILSTLDPHSVLLPPEMAKEMDVQIQGEFGGLGITISLRGEDNILTVINTLPDTPAARAGLKAGDQILQIEDESTINMSLSEAVNRLRGKVGTEVTIMVNRKGWGELLKFKVKRETIRIESVVSKSLGDGIGYVHIKTFQHTTSHDLRRALDKLRAEGGPLKGLVLDLRDNPGGPLQQAIEVADLFVESGTIVVTVQSTRRTREDFRASRLGTEDPYPIVVITDSASASASEIVAGALKNLNRGVVIGDQTFGKGSVQNLYSYPDHSKLKLTMAKYLTPGDKSIQSIGITPDIRVLPVYFDEKRTWFYSTGHVFREKDLESHFFNEQGEEPEEKSRATIRYFSPDEFKMLMREPDEPLPPPDPDAPSEPDPADDYQVRFARDLIRKGGRSTRLETLRAGRPFVQSEIQKKNAEIQEHLHALNIDWSPGRSGQTSLTLHVDAGAEDGHAVEAGDLYPITLSVTNTGTSPAYQVRALTSSNIPAVSNLEFLFGRIDPGETRTLSREVKIPGSLFSVVDALKVDLFEAAEQKIGDAEALVRIQGRDRPEFSYNLVVIDDGSGKSRGNGDGLIQRGEEIDLLVMMQNVGKGKAEKALAKIQNRNGREVYLKKGTANLGAIAPGEWSLGRFHFTVREGYRSDMVEFDMIAGDAGFIRRPRDVVRLPVYSAPPRTIEPLTGEITVKQTSERVLVHAGALAESPVVASIAPGTPLTQTAAVDDWIRVRLPMKGEWISGWLQAQWVDSAPSTPHPSDAGITPVFTYVPPSIAIASSIPREYPAGTTTMTLSGEVRDDGAVDEIYIFVNNKKRYLHALDPAELKPVAGGGVNARFTADLPLEEGANTIEIYARDNDKIQSLDLFQVYRATTPAEQARLESKSALPVQ